MLPSIPAAPESNRNSDSSEAVHDYAEIYTPSREGINWTQDNGADEGPRPPTPPLHRFPSWEAKIYQVMFELTFYCLFSFYFEHPSISNC